MPTTSHKQVKAVRATATPNLLIYNVAHVIYLLDSTQAAMAEGTYLPNKVSTRPPPYTCMDCRRSRDGKHKHLHFAR